MSEPLSLLRKKDAPSITREIIYTRSQLLVFLEKPENQILPLEMQDHLTQAVLQKFKDNRKQENKDKRAKKKDRERGRNHGRGRDHSSRPAPRDNPKYSAPQNLERMVLTEEEKLRK